MIDRENTEIWGEILTVLENFVMSRCDFRTGEGW